MKKQDLTNQILGFGLEDFLDLGWITLIVARVIEAKSPDESVVFRSTTDVIRDLLEAKFATAGDAVEDDEGLFDVRSWDLSSEDALARIEKEWRELRRAPKTGDIMWLELTDAGRAAALRAETEEE
jgi:hypothetical protein